MDYIKTFFIIINHSHCLVKNNIEAQTAMTTKANLLKKAIPELKPLIGLDEP